MHETVKQFIFKIKIISSVYLMQYVFNLLLKCDCLAGLVIMIIIIIIIGFI